MSFTLRIFGHAGLVRMNVVNQGSQFSSDSVYQLQMPYLWAQSLTVNGATPVASTVAPTPTGKTLDPTTVLRIEVPDTQSIRYEVNPPGRSVAASESSPILSGLNQIQFGAGWTLSVIDAART